MATNLRAMSLATLVFPHVSQTDVAVCLSHTQVASALPPLHRAQGYPGSVRGDFEVDVDVVGRQATHHAMMLLQRCCAT
jgi:hypothetical protein